MSDTSRAATSGGHLTPLADATSPAAHGHKAAQLARLLRAGFSVPDGFVVPATRDLDAPDFAVEVARALDRLGAGTVAVRSSSTAEDLEGSSFAGMYESVLEVAPDDVVQAIRQVRDSAASERSRTYAAAVRSAASGAMAVLVQRMVPASAAGVAFTADPLTGERDRVLVSATRGLGDTLVSGAVDAEEWIVRDSTARPRGSVGTAVGPHDVLAVADVARRVQSELGAPVDVEWALAGAIVHVLQARPMTALPQVEPWDPGVPGAWMRDFRLGEWLGAPVTTLFESWGLHRIEQQLDTVLSGLLRMPPPQQSHVVVNGWYFYGFNVIPDTPGAMLSGLFRHVIPSLLRQPRRAAMALPALARFGVDAAEAAWRSEVLPDHLAAVERARQAVATTNVDELPDVVDDLLDHAGRYFASITLVAGFASKCEVPLAAFHRRHVEPTTGSSHLELLVGLEDEQPRDELHALRSIDWIEPTLGETSQAIDPESARTRHRAARHRRLEAEQRDRAAVATDARLARRFDRLLERAQRWARVREEQVGAFSLAWPVMRQALRRIGVHLVDTGALERPEQVFHLTHDELLAALAGHADGLSEAADGRERLRQQQARLVPPLVIGTLPPMFAKVVAQARLAIAGPADADPDHVVGIPASGGLARGPVRVVRHPDQLDDVQAGDVLVCPMTAPAWTPVFGRIAAIVTDTGGVAAHASIIAREYGIPAIVGTGDATARLSDGMVVEVDAAAGVVRPTT